MLAAAALSVRALPIYVFYALFGSLFAGSLQHLYYLLPLLHLPLLKGITFISNFRMLTMHVVPAWIVGFLIGHLVMLIMVYISTFLGLGSGQMGVVIEEWRRTNPYTGDRHHAVENLDAMVANTISSIGYLIEHVKILLLLDTTFAWVVLLVGAGALVLCVSSGRRHLPAKLLSLGVILAHFVAVIPVGIHILFRTSTPLAIGIAALLFLTPQVRLRHRTLVGQMVLLSCLTVAWSTQSINTLSWRASITNTYYHCCPNKVNTINHNLLFLNQNHWFSTGHRLERHEAYATIAYSLSEGMVMYSGQFVFSQVMEHLPMKTFRKCVQRYQGDRRVQSFTCFDQFLCMAFAQITYRESLRDIEACLRAHKDKLYHMGIRGGMSRNTLANANQRRDWRIYAEFAQAMIRIAALYMRMRTWAWIWTIPSTPLMHPP